jgi:hypothetical protein
MQKELQALLDLVTSMLTEAARLIHPRLVIGDFETASTDGWAYVRLPQDFLGQPLELPDAIALLAHEIGHWLQPLKKIEEVETQTQLNHAVVNLLLDIQLEAQVIRIFPLFGSNLTTLREKVGRKYKRDYLDGIAKSKDFLTEAVSRLLMGRYCVEPAQPFFPYRHRTHAKMSEFLEAALSFMSLPSADLPKAFRIVAQRYPELCQPNSEGLDRLLDGEGQTPSDAARGGGIEIIADELQKLAPLSAHPGEMREQVGQLAGRVAPSREVLALSRKLERRWMVSHSAGRMMAPGRVDRLSALRGDPVPFYAEQKSGKQSDNTKIVLIADWSGSMHADPWRATLQAAQAITLAVRNTGGDARGAIFSTDLIHEKDFSPEIFFSDSIGSASMLDAHGPDTDFGWLPIVWQTFPNHRVLLLTDGAGHPPQLALPSARRRTSTILLKVRSNLDAQAVQEIEGVVSGFSERFVHVDSLEEIAAAWSVVIPRRAQ